MKTPQESGTVLSWKPNINGMIPVVGTIIINVLINNLQDGTRKILIEFFDYGRLGEGTHIPEGHAATQRYLERQEKWAEEPHQAQQREMLTPAPGEE